MMLCPPHIPPLTPRDQGPRPDRDSLYLPIPARLTHITKLTDYEKLFAVEFCDGRPLQHAPGQFVQVSLFGYGECPISVCSSPTRPERFELCIRKVGMVTDALHRLEGGAIIGIRGPLGHGFDLDRLLGKDVVIVAGGCGLAPVRSLIQYILDERTRFGRFDLLYGCRSPGELLFRDDLAEWKKKKMNLHVTVDRADPGWQGCVGVVTTLFKFLPRLDPGATAVVIVGPPVMFRFVIIEVLARRIPEESIFCSLERRMKCGVGLCGHCQVNDRYTCVDGPMFDYGQIKNVPEAL